MWWTWKEEDLDLILVPFGISIMFFYHLFFLYRYLNHPQLTSLGYENHNKKAWVEKMLLIDAKDRSFGIGVLNGQLSGSTSLCAISLVLCSLIGTILGNSSSNFLKNSFIFGDTSQTTNSIKYIALLCCFLLAFACFVQTTRHLVHANFLISMATGDVPVHCIQTAVIRGSNFWAVGLRALYFATTLLLWIFGPIPMFVGSIVTVITMHCLDINKIPLIQYGSNTSSVSGAKLFEKIGKEITSMIGGFEHNRSVTQN